MEGKPDPRRSILPLRKHHGGIHECAEVMRWISSDFRDVSGVKPVGAIQGEFEATAYIYSIYPTYIMYNSECVFASLPKWHLIIFEGLARRKTCFRTRILSYVHDSPSAEINRFEL